MLYLILEIALFLLLAAVIGFLLGWILKIWPKRNLYNELEEKFEHKYTKFETRFSEFYSEFENLRPEIDSLKRNLDSKLAEYDSKTDTKFSNFEETLAKSKAELSENITATENRISKFEDRFVGLKSELESFEEKFNTNLSEYDFKMKKNLSTFEERISIFKSELDKLKENLDNMFVTYDTKISNNISNFEEKFSSFKTHFLNKDFNDRMENVFLKIKTVEENFNAELNNINIEKSVNGLRESIDTVENKLLSEFLNKQFEKNIIDNTDEISKLKESLNRFDVLENNFTSIVDEKDVKIKELEERIYQLENPPEVIPKDDDLKEIKGINTVLEKFLHENGILTFKNMALLSKEDINNLSERLNAFKKRIYRDNWMAQARILHFDKYGEKLEV